MLSILDVFRIGIGPSSSHTVGPIRIANRFISGFHGHGGLAPVARIEVRLLGSLAFTGEGHATPKAVILGLLGFDPETLEPEIADSAVAAVHATRQLNLMGERLITFDPARDIVFDYDTVSDLHPNGMCLTAYGKAGDIICTRDYFSTGGGFIASRRQLETPAPDDLVSSGNDVRWPFSSAAELLDLCREHALPMCEIVLGNEDSMRPRDETLARLDRITDVMMACIDRGLASNGLLPGRIIPSVIRHYCKADDGVSDKARTFLLTAGGIGLLYKQRASISGAEMGCQGEVGVACSMAAGGLAAVWGASPIQVAQAAEIGMEHNLGLTCDPVGGLVQIPCIERNAIGAVKAVNAARLAMHSTGPMKVSLDQVIETMRQTGLDMSSKYKETSQGGLAVNVVEC